MIEKLKKNINEWHYHSLAVTILAIITILKYEEVVLSIILIAISTVLNGIGALYNQNKKQSEYTTKVAKDAMNENKSIKQSKKELIKNILMKAGYDPTIRYTRKEKKHFTRIVKNNMFTKPKGVTLTTEQIKEKIKADKLAKKSMQAKFDESVRNNPLTPKKGKQMVPSAAELSVKEKPNKRNFQYAIQRKCSDNDMKVYDFATGNFEASTRDEAKNKAAKLAKKYKKDTSFTGVTVKDIEGDNSITYYSRNKLLAA